MENITFSALEVRQGDRGLQRQIVQRQLADLPDNEVVVQVHYSSLNYKDALSASGNRGVTRRYPHTPGIDAAGVVVNSSHAAVRPGAEVIVHCYDLGMNTPGGFGGYIRVPAAWVVPLPAGLTLRQAMLYGTAGFTAGLSVHKMLAQGVEPNQGPVLVTGATGGVGSLAVAMLAREGFAVTAASGKAAADFLISLGAKKVVERRAVSGGKDKAMLRPRWAGVVDCVGGGILAHALKATKAGGAVTSCGNVAGAELHITVYPFILRGIALLGVDAAECPLPLRCTIWQRLAQDWNFAHLEAQTQEVDLAGLNVQIDRILAGKIQGRILINHKV